MTDVRSKTGRDCNTNVEDGNNNVSKEMSDEMSDSGCLFSLPQRLLLDQQMRQHVQQLTQNYLLTYDHPNYNKYAPEIMSLLVSSYSIRVAVPQILFQLISGNSVKK